MRVKVARLILFEVFCLAIPDVSNVLKRLRDSSVDSARRVNQEHDRNDRDQCTLAQPRALDVLNGHARTAFTRGGNPVGPMFERMPNTPVVIS